MGFSFCCATCELLVFDFVTRFCLFEITALSPKIANVHYRRNLSSLYEYAVYLVQVSNAAKARVL